MYWDGDQDTSSAGSAATRTTRVPSQYPKRRLFVRSRKVSKPRDWYIKLSYRFEIWQAHWQHCCRSACQISERSDNSKYKSRGFETLRDLTKIRLFGYWDGAQVWTPLMFGPTWNDSIVARHFQIILLVWKLLGGGGYPNFDGGKVVDEVL